MNLKKGKPKTDAENEYKCVDCLSHNLPTFYKVLQVYRPELCGEALLYEEQILSSNKNI